MNTYFDICATPPIDKDVLDFIHTQNQAVFGNPSSIYLSDPITIRLANEGVFANGLMSEYLFGAKFLSADSLCGQFCILHITCLIIIEQKQAEPVLPQARRRL